MEVPGKALQGAFPSRQLNDKYRLQRCSLHPCTWSCCFTSAAYSLPKLNTCCDDGDNAGREEGEEPSGAGANLAALPGQRHRGALAPGPVMPPPGPVMPSRTPEQASRGGWMVGSPARSHHQNANPLPKTLGLTLPGRCCLKDAGFYLSGGVLKRCHPAYCIGRNYRWKGRMEAACLVTFH